MYSTGSRASTAAQLGLQLMELLQPSLGVQAANADSAAAATSTAHGLALTWLVEVLQHVLCSEGV